jgi:probable phosphoglycerate mutase
VPTTIVLVRHGETDWNRENRFQGHADPPRNEAGRAQSREVAEQLVAERVTIVYTSPLQRAHETARILAARLDLDVRVSDALEEVDVGSWSGLTRAEVEARFPDGFRRWVE